MIVSKFLQKINQTFQGFKIYWYLVLVILLFVGDRGQSSVLVFLAVTDASVLQYFPGWKGAENAQKQ